MFPSWNFCFYAQATSHGLPRGQLRPPLQAAFLVVRTKTRLFSPTSCLTLSWVPREALCLLYVLYVLESPSRRQLFFFLLYQPILLWRLDLVHVARLRTRAILFPANQPLQQKSCDGEQEAATADSLARPGRIFNTTLRFCFWDILLTNTVTSPEKFGKRNYLIFRGSRTPQRRKKRENTNN